MTQQQQPFPPNYPQHPQQQQPSQYPGYYYSPPHDPLTPAKRASILMFVMAGLALCCGLCMGIGALVPWEQMINQDPNLAPLQEAVQKLGVSINVVFAIAAGILIVPAVVYVVLGIFVRRGSSGATITAIVLTSLALLFHLWNLIVTAARAGGGGMPRAAGGLCVGVVLLGLEVLLLIWLIQAVKAASRYAGSGAHYQQQYWQYQQHQQQQPHSPLPVSPQQMPAPPTFNNSPPPPPPQV